MQEHEVRELFERLREAMDPAEEYKERHQDYLVEFPSRASGWTGTASAGSRRPSRAAWGPRSGCAG
jgi:hypothetical protein